MNIVRAVCTKRMFLPLFALVSSAGAVRYALTPHNTVTHCDPRGAYELQRDLAKLIEKMSVRSVGARGILKQLQTDYPFLESVTISYSSSLKANVDVAFYRPILLFVSARPGQKEYVLCKDGKVFDKCFYNENALSGLAKISIEGPFEEKRNDAALIKCALQLSPDIVESYDITWRSKSDICLRSKTVPIVVSADEVTIHEQQRYVYVHRIFTEENERYKEGLKADIRLPDEIVCSPLAK